MKRGENAFSPESASEKFEIVPAKDSRFFKNCVVIKEGKIPTLVEVAAMAVKNEAFAETQDEGGDDSYLIQFPGHEQKVMSEDDITGKIRALLNPEDRRE